MNPKSIALLCIFAIAFSDATAEEPTQKDLITPAMTSEAPAAGKRVRQVAPEYQGTEVYHSLYLPTDWKPGGKYPVLVEYTGNKFPPGKGSGEVKDANLGYGMTGGRGFIWVVMPYVEQGRKENAVQWWGDKQATVDYCKINLPRICESFGGDLNNVFLCGFSRGAIGAGYIGMADDEIASLWKGIFTHDHFDGQREWGYPESDRESALKRLARLNGRPVLICGQNASSVRDDFLGEHLDLAQFTFLDVPTKEIFNIPEGPYLHPHTDLWMHRESPFRQQARDWLDQVLNQKRNTAPDTASADGPVQGFLAAHCRDCHAGEDPEGDFHLASLSSDFSDPANRQSWLTVLQQVESGNMPPAKRTRPDAKATEAFVERISADVAAAESEQRRTRGRVVLRRLNRNEYVNTIRDLLAVEVDLKDLFPDSTSTSGFDNDAESLHTSTYLLENYLAAADRALDAAIANGPRPPTAKVRLDIRDSTSVRPTGSVYRHVDDGVAIFATSVAANIQVTLWRFMSRHDGKYRFRISGYGYQTDKPVSFHVKAGPMNAAAQQYLIGYYEVPPTEPTVVEFFDQMKARQTIRIVADGLKTQTREVERIGADQYTGPGMVVQWVEAEGPLLPSWPPESHQRLFGDLPQQTDPQDRNRREVVSQQPLVDAERILSRFARRAFRRPVTHSEIKPFLDRVEAKLAAGDSFEQAVRVGLKAVLVAPQFLFLHERPGDRLDDFALASRLSYFLWSSMPDDELLELAEQQTLSEPGALRSQVERMLNDPKSQTLTENFTTQWLALRAIDDTMPDRMLYPEFDDLLKESMVKEVKLFFEEMLKRDLSIANFVDSDFTMLNGRLAQHYGIADVEGMPFRKVTLPPDSHRGGVLTMAAILKVTANGTTTSPILRGSWVLDRILGSPPPKPTVDVEAVEPDIRGSTTIRAQLEKHRQDPACASCHIKIDPPGFALENFDVIGGWRDHYRSIGEGEPVIVDGNRMRYRSGPPVDASDVLADGRSFAGIDQYKQLLLADKDQLARALAANLVHYATGAAVTTADRDTIDGIVERIRDQDYGLRSLVHEIVQSELFQHK